MDWNSRKKCKNFIKKGDVISFAEHCKSYIPNNSDFQNKTLYGKLKTFVTRRNKPRLLRSALKERNLASEEERQTRRAAVLNAPIRKLNNVKQILQKQNITNENIINGQSRAQNLMKEFENIRNNSTLKKRNRGYTMFSKNYYHQLNTEAESLRQQASQVYSKLEQIKQQRENEKKRAEEEERISLGFKPYYLTNAEYLSELREKFESGQRMTNQESVNFVRLKAEANRKARENRVKKASRPQFYAPKLLPLKRGGKTRKNRKH